MYECSWAVLDVALMFETPLGPATLRKVEHISFSWTEQLLFELGISRVSAIGFTVISNKVLTTAVLELVRAAVSESLETAEMLLGRIPAVAMLVKPLVFEVSAVSVSVVSALMLLSGRMLRLLLLLLMVMMLLSGRMAFLFFHDPSSTIQAFNSKSSSFRTNDLSRLKNWEVRSNLSLYLSAWLVMYGTRAIQEQNRTMKSTVGCNIEASSLSTDFSEFVFKRHKW